MGAARGEAWLRRPGARGRTVPATFPEDCTFPRAYPTSSLHQCLTRPGAGILHPAWCGWLAGWLLGAGGRTGAHPWALRCARTWGGVNLQWRSQGTRHGDPTYFPAVIREPWALQSLGHVRVCLGPAFSCGLGIADVARSVGQPNDQINTCPWEGCSGRNRSHRQGSRGGTPTPDHAPAPWPHRDTEKFCLTQLKIRSGDCRGRCRLLGEEAGQQGKGPTQRLVLVSSCRTARLYPLHSYSQTVYCRPVCFPGLSRSQPSRPQLLPSPWAEMSPVGSIYQHQQVAVGKCHCPPGVLVRACPAALPEVDSGMVNAGSGRLAPLLITQPLRLSFPSVTW